MRAAVVLNGKAGALVAQRNARMAAAVHRLFAEAGVRAEVRVAEGADIPRAIARAVASSCDAVFVGGGDGTIAAAAERLAGTDRPLGILPLGTANLLAKDLKIPLGLEDAVRALVGGATRTIDTAEVNGRIFLNSSLIGVVPLMVNRRERLREVPGLLKWLRLAVTFFRIVNRYPRLRVVLRADGRLRRITTRALVIANNPFDTGFGTVLSRSTLDSGELGLYIARLESRLGIVRLALRVLTGTWHQDQALESMKVRRLDVVSLRRRLWVANDGENRLIETPLRYRIRPKSLTVLVPRDAVPAAATEGAPEASIEAAAQPAAERAA